MIAVLRAHEQRPTVGTPIDDGVRQLRVVSVFDTGLPIIRREIARAVRVDIAHEDVAAIGVRERGRVIVPPRRDATLGRLDQRVDFAIGEFTRKTP